MGRSAQSQRRDETTRLERSRIMTEAATVFWYPQEIKKAADGGKLGGRDRKFESVENAATFVMEKLSATERGTSIIMTDSRSIYPMDIQGIYEGLKTRKKVASVRSPNARVIIGESAS
jgi:hypothetical protein